MDARSSLSEAQRGAAVALFEAGLAKDAAAARLGVSASAVGRLYDRWRLRGAGALVTKRTKRTFSYETKLEVARRYAAGDTALGLAQEFELSSPQLVTAWARLLREGGAEALRPKPKGRAPAVPDGAVAEVSELTRLRRENERLRAEVAYLGKLRALREHGRR